jgi:hypothetical protein
MKNFRSTTGPFLERPFYEDREIETICTEALREVGLLPTRPEAVRIDRFIEKRFGVVPTYEDLPDGVLGLTRFGQKGVREVVVAKALDDDSSTVAERRIRTTLAHEGGHCLLHAHLFALATPTQKLFGDFSEPDKPKVLCRDEVLGNSRVQYAGNWWEFQANRAIGGLLMPSALVTESLGEFMLKGPAGFPHFDHDRIEEAARALAEVFNVNPLVAKIRIKQLFGADTQQQWLL